RVLSDLFLHRSARAEHRSQVTGTQALPASTGLSPGARRASRAVARAETTDRAEDRRRPLSGFRSPRQSIPSSAQHTARPASPSSHRASSGSARIGSPFRLVDNKSAAYSQTRARSLQE